MLVCRNNIKLLVNLICDITIPALNLGLFQDRQLIEIVQLIEIRNCINSQEYY